MIERNMSSDERAMLDAATYGLRDCPECGCVRMLCEDQHAAYHLQALLKEECLTAPVPFGARAEVVRLMEKLKVSESDVSLLVSDMQAQRMSA